jgi:hypothetical protein
LDGCGDRQGQYGGKDRTDVFAAQGHILPFRAGRAAEHGRISVQQLADGGVGPRMAALVDLVEETGADFLRLCGRFRRAAGMTSVSSSRRLVTALV